MLYALSARRVQCRQERLNSKGGGEYVLGTPTAVILAADGRLHLYDFLL
jgi:hypothetical protein